MTCPSCGWPEPDRYADSCAYCDIYWEVRASDDCRLCGGDGLRVAGWDDDAHENIEERCPCTYPPQWRGRASAQDTKGAGHGQK